MEYSEVVNKSKNEIIERTIIYKDGYLKIRETKTTLGKKKRFEPYCSTLEYTLSQSVTQSLLEHLDIRNDKNIIYRLMDEYIRNSFYSLHSLLTKNHLPAKVCYTYVQGRKKTVLQI